MEPQDEVSILLVEDNPGDVRLTREALRDSRIHNRMDVVGDGEAALRFLRREGEFTEAVRPDLLLLDLNLPRLNGNEVLRQIKEDPLLRRIPVVVLTTSKAEADVVQSYDLHANSYVVKPVSFDQFVDAIRTLEDFWFSLVKLPRVDDDEVASPGAEATSG